MKTKIDMNFCLRKLPEQFRGFSTFQENRLRHGTTLVAVVQPEDQTRTSLEILPNQVL